MELTFSQMMEQELDYWLLLTTRQSMLEEIMVLRWGWIVL